MYIISEIALTEVALSVMPFKFSMEGDFVDPTGHRCPWCEVIFNGNSRPTVGGVEYPSLTEALEAALESRGAGIVCFAGFDLWRSGGREVLVLSKADGILQPIMVDYQSLVSMADAAITAE